MSRVVRGYAEERQTSAHKRSVGKKKKHMTQEARYNVYMEYIFRHIRTVCKTYTSSCHVDVDVDVDDDDARRVVPVFTTSVVVDF